MGTISSYERESLLLSQVADTHQSTTKWYWSPALHWRRQGDEVTIGSTTFPLPLAALFPEFYFRTLQGTYLQSLRRCFPEIPDEEWNRFTDELIRRRILVSNLLPVMDLFAGQEALFSHPHGDTLSYDPKSYEKFKQEQLNRKPPIETSDVIPLPANTCAFPSELTERRSHRRYSPALLPFETFSRFLSVLRQNRDGDEIRYFYPSNGGLYGIDTYCWIRPQRVAGIEDGIYYYDSIENALRLVTHESDPLRNIHLNQNRAMSACAAFTFFFVFNPDVTMPVYGPPAYFLSFIEAGMMVSCLNYIAALTGIGLCSIGLVDFAGAHAGLKLRPCDQLLHVVEGGLAVTDEKSASDPSAQDAISVVEIRRFLSETLPEHMIPSDYVVLDKLPLNPNNKLDRAALCGTEGERLDLGTDYVNASNEIEALLTKIWQRVLERNEIGIDDNFFDLGGDSIGVAEVHDQLMAERRLDIRIAKLFQFPTIRTLAQFLNEYHPFDGFEPGQSRSDRTAQSHANTGEKEHAKGCAPNSEDLKERDLQAREWAQVHPDDPRADRILKLLREKEAEI